MPTVTTTVTSATAGTTTTVTTTKATPAPAPAVAAAAPTYAPFVLQYFDVMAKGLGPTLVAEHSGLAYKGNTDKESRVNYKTVSPFMQQPVLIFDGLVVSQTVAIMNYIGRKAGKHMEGETDVAYANSQMFIAEAEDLYAGLLKYFATIGRPCRCTTDEKAAYWAEVVPKHFACLEKMVSHQQPACLTLLASCTSTRCSTKSSLSALGLQQCWRPSQHCCRSTRAWRHTPSRKRSLRERRTWECSANTFRLRILNRSKRPMHLQRCSLASPLLHCRQESTAAQQAHRESTSSGKRRALQTLCLRS